MVQIVAGEEVRERPKEKVKTFKVLSCMMADGDISRSQYTNIEMI